MIRAALGEGLMSRFTGTAGCLIAATLLGCVLARAQGTAAPPADPVIAKVDEQPIHLSELKDAAQTLPENLRGMPTQTLYPMLLEQLIDGRALAAEARKSGLDKDPAVQRQVVAAEDRTLQAALLNRELAPSITEAALRARYDQEIGGKPGEEEVHAKHILVSSEAEAKKIIGQLKGGADFAALAKEYSKDQGGAQEGGDLGFFKRSEMVPEFAAAAFALKPGQMSEQPVQTQFGWHVIMVVERRRAAALSFDQARDQLRQRTIQEGVQKAVAKARASASVEKFNLDGSPSRPTDTAEPPAAPIKQ